jgi:hypothetical protein
MKCARVLQQENDALTKKWKVVAEEVQKLLGAMASSK